MVSILIPSRNNPGLLRKCLESIKNNTSYQNYEIIVIDNGSSGENRLRFRITSYNVCYTKLLRTITCGNILRMEPLMGLKAGWI